MIEITEEALKSTFDALENMYPVWKKHVGRNRAIERAIGELRGKIATTKYRQEYELIRMIEDIEVTDIREGTERKWKEVARADWGRIFKLCFGREYKGEYFPNYDVVWVFPSVPEIGQEKIWVVIKGQWKKEE